MPKRAFIFGGGGHAHVIASLIEAEPVFLVSENPSGGQMLQSTFFDRADEMRGEDVYIGIGDNQQRTQIFMRLQDQDIRVSNCIGANTFVARDACLGEGVVLCPGSVVGARARIGNNVIINTLASVDHDCILGDHSQVTPGVTFAGRVTVGSGCLFGVKSAIIPGLSIGSNVFVMPGAIVTKSLPDNVVARGVPARIVHTGRNCLSQEGA